MERTEARKSHRDKAVGSSVHLFLSTTGRKSYRAQTKEVWVTEKDFREFVVHPLPHKKGKEKSTPYSLSVL